MILPASMPWLAALLAAQSIDELRAALRQRWPNFVSTRLRRLAIVGAAEEGVRLAGLCAEHGIEAVAVVDDDPAKQGMEIGSCRVAPVSSLADLDPATPVVVASHRTFKICDRMQTMGLSHCAPFALLQTLDPAAFPPHMFYKNWLEDLFENRKQYVELTNVLADDFSRQVLDANIGYRLTCDPNTQRSVIEWDLYGPSSLLSYGAHEVYVDGGSYDGDSIRLFAERVGHRYDRIVGFEPDSRTFARLQANFANEPRVETVNKGLFSRSGCLRFDAAGTRGARLNDAPGSVEVQVVSLDDHLGDARVSFIKLNIEGVEREALQGARGVIERWAPTLAVSAYHRPADLWEIAVLVRTLRDDYNLYLRQHDGGVIETVLYAIARKEK